MSIILSTGTRNAMVGKPDTLTAATISFTVTTNVISDSGNALLSSGFRPGDSVVISGTTSNNMVTRIKESEVMTAGTMVVEDALATESAGTSFTISTVGGKAYADIYRNHVIGIYSGSAPSTADTIETGTLLCLLTKASGAFTPGTATNGLNYDESAIAAGVASGGGEIISGVGLVAGTAGYYRRYDNGYITGTTTTGKRTQGTVGSSNADLILTSVTVAIGATITASSDTAIEPAS